MSQLDGSDIVYTARVPVPKIIAISVQIGTRFPAAATSMGRVLLADLDPSELDDVLATPSASGVIPRVVLSRSELDKSLAEIRERGWALSDELLSLGIRSIAAPVRDRSRANGGGDERHGACRRDVDRACSSTSTSRCSCRPPPTSRRRGRTWRCCRGHHCVPRPRRPRLTARSLALTRSHVYGL